MTQTELSRVFPQWEIEKQLQRSPYGTVYQAVRRDGERTTRSAIKVISIPPEADSDFSSADELDRQAIRAYLKGIADQLDRNISRAAHLSYYGADGIAGILEHHMVEKSDSLGWDLCVRRELLTPFTTYLSDKVLTEREAIRLGCDICATLEVCGSRDLLHGDIRPETIFVDSLGSFRLDDFGTARIMAERGGIPLPQGTVLYAAPELVSGGTYSPQADVYALGMVLYRLLNGNRLPFLSDKQLLSSAERQTALDRRLRGEKLPPPRNASEELAHVLLKACAFKPQDRFTNAAEFRQALLSVLSGTYILPKSARKQKAKKKSAPAQKERSRTSTAVIILLTVFVTLLLVFSSCLGLYLYRQRPVEIAVARIPSRHFMEGDQVSTDGMSLLVKYANGSQQILESGFSVSPQILMGSGKQEVTVSYLWLKDTYTVNVEKQIVSLDVLTLPRKTTYTAGDVLNTYGLSLEVIYSDGTSETVTKNLSFEPLTLRGEGAQEVTVTYKDSTTSFFVNMRPKEDPFFENPTLSCTGWVDGYSGLNDNGEAVNWCLCIEFDLSKLSRARYKESVTCSWAEVVNGDGSQKYATSFDTAKEGMTYAVFEVIPAEESSTGNERFRMWIMLPDDPSIAGRQAVSAFVSGIDKTFTFELIYHGDYDTGTGWGVKDVEVQ